MCPIENAASRTREQSRPSATCRLQKASRFLDESSANFPRPRTKLKESAVSSVCVGTLAPDGMHLLAHSKLTLDENQNLPFAWTPDSKSVFFSSNRNGNSEIFKQTTDRSLAENVMTSSEVLVQPRVAPDGSELLYISTPKSSDLKTPSSIFAIPIAGGTPRLILRDVGMMSESGT